MADLEISRAKQVKTLKETLNMYKESLSKTLEHMKKEKNGDGTNRYSAEDIENKRKEILEMGVSPTIEQYQFMGGDMEDIRSLLDEIFAEPKEEPKKKKKISIPIDEVVAPVDKGGSVGDKLAKAKKTTQKKESAKEDEAPVKKATKSSTPASAKFIDKTAFIPRSYSYNPETEFDMLPLPSKGQCYVEKNDSIAVSPLNGYDENLMVSPNLYRNGTLIDVILKRKVMGDIDINDLLDGDRDAIVLWLRATGYGNEYPLSLKDPDTGKEFETVVDLSDINFKPFKLIGDENGWFDFELPVSKDKIKFKFLTHRDKEELNMIDKMENTLLMKGEILTMARTIENFIENNSDIDEEATEKFTTAKKLINEATDMIDTSDAQIYTESLTNRMEYSIMSINGNSDRDYISNYVRRMPVRDSFALRTYMTENEPGVDFKFEVKKPESLGGGSMPVFLSINQFVFLNVSR